MRVKKVQYSKRRKKRQYEEIDFTTFWSDTFNFANLGAGYFFDDAMTTRGGTSNILGTLALTGSVGGVMMAGMPTPSFQVNSFHKNQFLISSWNRVLFYLLLIKSFQYLII